MALIAGIDEAGRGPCIGPLVICAYMINEKDMSLLANIGAKDSKLLSAPKRQKMFAELQKAAKGYEIIEISPAEIDEAVESENTNLNWLEAQKAAMLLNRLNPDIAIIDCPSPNLKAYRDFVYNCLKKKNMELVIEHKAERHLPVAAASIIAKVTRDKRIEEIKQKIGLDFGSGYPADPSTKAFIEKYWRNYPDIIRKSWATYKAVVNKQKTIAEF
ncbi:MAG: ribonuclease HII [Nanoarchaeota archaeon]|nr:ribonuclease HII [Nanoarchaeota archaeon]